MTAARFDKVETELDFPADERAHPRVLEGARASSRRRSRATRGPATALRLLRGPAHRQRPAAQRPRAHARHQGRLPPLQDDARLPRARARPAGTPTACPVEVEVEKELAHPRQGGDRGATASSPSSTQLHRLACSATRRSGRSSPSAIGFWVDLAERVRHLPQELRRERLVGALRAVQEGPALPGPQGRLVVGAGRHRALRGRGRARATRRSTTPASSSRFPLRGRAGHGARSSGRRRPWTLPSNMYAAVQPDVRVRRSSTPATAKLIVAAALRDGARQEAQDASCPVVRDA